MRILLAGILILIPFNAQGQVLDAPCDERELPSSAEPAGSPTIEQPVIQGDTSVCQTLEPLNNPYSPASATNFDPFAASLTPRPEVNDRSRLSVQRDNPVPIDAIYGHFGSPLFPDSIEHRGETAHPYAMDSSTNLYGRNKPLQGRERR